MRAILTILLLAAATALAEVSPLGTMPNWKRLDAYQETMRREEFARALDEIYALNGNAKTMIRLAETHADIRVGDGEEWRSLRFLAEDGKTPKVRRYWRPAKSLPKAPAGKPLQGLRVALDPGHIGGEWAKMEERWFLADEAYGLAIQEGDMTLRVAEILKPRLEALGAKVTLTRSKLEPVTRQRPKDFLNLARADLATMGLATPRESYLLTEPTLTRTDSVQWHSEKYFYRTAEIRARAHRVNNTIKPDIVICLHFNAEAWANPWRPAMIDRNHMHILVNGHYDMTEIGQHDQRHEMLMRVLQRSHEEELAVAESVAESLARETGLPPFQYITPNAHRVGVSPYVWARNLMAGRLFECPVIYLEPYVMNNDEVAARVAAGDYEGEREVAGKVRKSIYREYAEGVIAGLTQYYQKARL